jgi:hypothetical protein
MAAPGAAEEASRGVFFSIFIDRQSQHRRRLVCTDPTNAPAGKFPATNAPENGQQNCPISADLDRFAVAAQAGVRPRARIF